MLRNPVGEFHLSSGRSFRPRCEQLEERIVLNDTAMPPMNQQADPNAFAALAGLTDVITSLNAQLAQRVLSASAGVDLNAAKGVNRLAGNLSKIVAAFQPVEMQIVQSQASVNDPSFRFADILFRAAVADSQVVQRVANGVEADILNNILGGVRTAAHVSRQINTGVNAVNNFVNQAKQALGQ